MISVLFEKKKKPVEKCLHMCITPFICTLLLILMKGAIISEAVNLIQLHLNIKRLLAISEHNYGC